MLLARLGPTLEGHPDAIVIHRLFNVALVAIGLAALMAIGLIAKLPRLTLYAYIVPIACIPVLVPLAGAINNDNAAFAGGGIATLAAFQLLATGKPDMAIGGTRRRRHRSMGEVHRAAAGRRIGRRRIALAAVARTLAVALDRADRDCRPGGGRALYRPVRAVWQPDAGTPGQIAMIKSGVLAVGWDSAERHDAGRLCGSISSRNLSMNGCRP